MLELDVFRGFKYVLNLQAFILWLLLLLQYKIASRAYLVITALMQVTYCPDCTRACKYDTEPVIRAGGFVKGSDFFNYVFGCLFLNETAHVSPL